MGVLVFLVGAAACAGADDSREHSSPASRRPGVDEVASATPANPTVPVPTTVPGQAPTKVLVLGDSGMADAAPAIVAMFQAMGSEAVDAAAGGLGLTRIGFDRETSTFAEDWAARDRSRAARPRRGHDRGLGRRVGREERPVPLCSRRRGGGGDPHGARSEGAVALDAAGAHHPGPSGRPRLRAGGGQPPRSGLLRRHRRRPAGPGWDHAAGLSGARRLEGAAAQGRRLALLPRRRSRGGDGDRPAGGGATAGRAGRPDLAARAVARRSGLRRLPRVQA